MQESEPQDAEAEGDRKRERDALRRQDAQRKRRRPEEKEEEGEAGGDEAAARAGEDEEEDETGAGARDGADEDKGPGGSGGEEDDEARDGPRIHTAPLHAFSLAPGQGQGREEDEDEDDDQEKDEDMQVVIDEGQGQGQGQEQQRELWARHRQQTDPLATRLCEQLRLVLEPTLATRLQGDFRTGKRISMRRVIGYIASGFRKDKIWLRRTKPAKRDYQVLLMIDDSSSMGAAGPIALSALATISMALTRLEVGELAVCSFAEQLRLLHPFGRPFTEDVGAAVMGSFAFAAGQTRLGASLRAVESVFHAAKSGAGSGSGGAGNILQLCFVVSDARIDSDNREALNSTVRRLAEQNVLVVLIIIDKNADAKDSIFNTRSVEFRGDKVVTSAYLDHFPFPYYIAIQRLESLPDVLCEALKGWFEVVHQQLGT
jgi:midasin